MNTQKKKKNKFIIPTVCIICMIIIVVTLYIMNNTLYKSLDLTYGNVSKYTITSGSTGNVYDITNEEINNIIEKKRTGTEITDADEEIVLVPVSVYSETVSSGGSYYYYSYNEKEVVTDVVPYISAPSLALVDVDNIKLRLTYSKQDMK